MLADALLLLFGTVTALLSLQLPLGTLHAPGSGLFPLLLGLILIGLAGCHLAQLCLSPAKSPASGESSVLLSRVLLFLATMALATGLLNVLGYPLVAFLMMLALLEILGIRRRRNTFLIAASAALVAHVLFVQWLKIPLPKGWIGL